MLVVRFWIISPYGWRYKMPSRKALKAIIKKQSMFILELLNDSKIPEEVRESKSYKYNDIVDEIISKYDSEEEK